MSPPALRGSWTLPAPMEKKIAMTDSAQVLTQIEERLAHLIRSVEEMSDVVARQDREILILQRRVQMLMEREAEREQAMDAPAANQRPPHW